MNTDNRVEIEAFENFKDWYNTPHGRTITPELIFSHFEKYFKPEWQKQQPSPVEGESEGDKIT